MTVQRLNELAADPRKVQAAQRTALVTKLVASKRDRASKIASLDGEVNAIFARFKAADAKFSRAALLKTISSLEGLRANIIKARQAALKDMATTIASNLPNKGVIAQYEDLSALSAKIAALIVTAKVSLAEDMPADEQMDEHDIVTIDSNGYVSEDNMQLAEDDEVEPVDEVTSPEDDLSVASEDGDEDDVGGDSDLEEEDVETPAQTVARLKASRAKAKRRAEDNNPNDGEAVAKAAGKKADNTTDPNDVGGTTQDPYADSVEDQRAGDPNAVEPNRVDTQPTAAKAKAKAKRALGEDPAEYPAEPEVVETPEEAVTAAGEDPAEYPAEPEVVETPEEAVTASDDEDQDDMSEFLDAEDDETDSSLAEQLDLPDSGIDEALQAEILDEDFVGDDEAEDGEVTASVSARGGKAARDRKLASATRTNPRASEDTVLKSLVTELMI